jgi:hypothetical protein
LANFRLSLDGKVKDQEEKSKMKEGDEKAKAILIL